MEEVTFGQLWVRAFQAEGPAQAKAGQHLWCSNNSREALVAGTEREVARAGKWLGPNLRGAIALVQVSSDGDLAQAAAVGVGQREVLGFKAQFGVKAPGFTDRRKWGWRAVPVRFRAVSSPAQRNHLQCRQMVGLGGSSGPPRLPEMSPGVMASWLPPAAGNMWPRCSIQGTSVPGLPQHSAGFVCRVTSGVPQMRKQQGGAGPKRGILCSEPGSCHQLSRERHMWAVEPRVAGVVLEMGVCAA